MEINWKAIGIAYLIWFIIVLIFAYFVNLPNYNLISNLLVYRAVLTLDFLVPFALSFSLFSVIISTGIPLGYYFSRCYVDTKEAALTSFIFGGISFVLLDLIITLLLLLGGFVLYGTFNLIRILNFTFMYTLNEWLENFVIFSVASTISGLIAYFLVNKTLKR